MQNAISAVHTFILTHAAGPLTDLLVEAHVLVQGGLQTVHVAEGPGVHVQVEAGLEVSTCSSALYLQRTEFPYS